MFLKWSTRAIVLLLICLLQIKLSKTQSYKKGCLDYSDLCDKNEFCHNDGLNGICIEDGVLNSNENLKQNSNDNILNKLNEPDELEEQDEKIDELQDERIDELQDCISKSILKYDKYKNQLDEETFLDLIKILCTDSISTGNEPKIPLNDNDDLDLKDWLLSNVNVRERLNLAKKFTTDQDGIDDLNNYEPQQKKNDDQPSNLFGEPVGRDVFKENENYNLNERFKEINKNLDEVEQYAKVNSDKNFIDKKLDQKKPGPFIIDDSDSKYDKRFDESRIKSEISDIFNDLNPNRDELESTKIPFNEKRFANNEFKFDNPTPPKNEDHKPVEEGAVHIELDKDNKNLKLVEPTAPGEKSQFAAIDSSYAFIYFKKSKKSIVDDNDNQMSNIQQPFMLKDDKSIRLDFLKGLEKKLDLSTGVFSNIDYNDVGKDNVPDCVPFSFLNYVIKFDNDEKSCNCKLLAVTFRVNPNSKDLNATAVADSIGQYQDLQEETGLVVIQTGIGDKVKIERKLNCSINLLQTFINLSLLATASILVVTLFIFYQRKDYLRQKIHNAVYGAPILTGWFGSEKDYTQCNLASKPQKLSKADLEKQALDYQDLCRQRMKANEQNKKSNNKEKADDTTKLIYQAGNNQAQSLEKCKTQQQSTVANDALINTAMNMDISTGHLILEYMENHLKQNGDKLNREWNALSSIDEFESTQNAAKLAKNKNRYPDDPSTWPFDNSRVLINDTLSKDHIDYINASTIIDSDPNPIYIATQGPMKDTISDFWEMAWSSQSSVIVMLTRLVENGVEQSVRYWPEKGSERYLHYEVNLVSEHIWSEQYLVRSLYLKNLLKNETRTVTQFHFMAWPENSVPSSPATLLEFRRKVNKSYREKSSPIIVMCSDGGNRTGAYCLIDMVLNRLTKGVKEIDLAATLEHLRDQRPGMIKDQQKFEFCLKAIAEEVHNLLRSLQQK